MMTVQQIFELATKLGVAADPRGESGVKKYLARIKKEYQNLKPNEQQYFDIEKLTNPYPDSFIHVNDQKTKVRRVLAGIDISASDILLASQLSERGRTIDLAISHHPVGKALSNLHEVMEMTVEIFISLGVPIHIAEKITEERIKEVSRNIHSSNHYQAVTTAELLRINFINTHTITDNMVEKFLNSFIRSKKPETIGDLMELLLEIPEYAEAKRRGIGPIIFAGHPRHRIGKYLVEMTGGTEPSHKMYQEFSRAGISTVVGMHMRNEPLEKATESHMNVVICGHMASDSIGMNLMLDELEKKGIEIVPCGGLIRVSRNKAL